VWGGTGARAITNSYELTYWVQPLPPPGELLFACEWPQRQIPLTTTTIDADVILAAAARAQELWPAPGRPKSGADSQRLPRRVDLTILAKLSCSLVRAQAVPRAA
jgi:hypothetical protein